MNSNDIMALGLGLTAPWRIVGQHLNIERIPSVLHLAIEGERGALYPCPICGKLCKAHDYHEFSWRHLNFFQHHCIITAKIPRVDCLEHGTHRITVPWARDGSRFTLLFEQVILLLAREMPVNAVSKYVGVTDKRIWRIIQYYVFKALKLVNLDGLRSIGLDETATKRGHHYVTIFVDMDRETRPVIFATPGKGKETLRAFASYIKQHGSNVDNVIEIVCDMSPAFLSGAAETFPNASITVDWFHVVQLFTKAVDEVRRLEAKVCKLPKGCRWAVLKNLENSRTEKQESALRELRERGLATATAFRIKELLRWVREAENSRAAKWRFSRFLTFANELLGENKLLEPVQKALRTCHAHMAHILRRWDSMLTNARLESLNGLFQAARSRAKGYRNVTTFITIIYLIAAPIQGLLGEQG